MQFDFMLDFLNSEPHIYRITESLLRKTYFPVKQYITGE